jgi:hypothetical protein
LRRNDPKKSIFLAYPDRKIYQTIRLTSKLDQQPKEEKKESTKNRTQPHMLKQLFHLYIMIITDRNRTIQKRGLHIRETRILQNPSASVNNFREFAFILNQKQRNLDQTGERESGCLIREWSVISDGGIRIRIGIFPKI